MSTPKSSQKGSMFKLDPELVKLNEKIKWPKKMGVIEIAKGIAVILLLLLTSGMGSVTFLLFPLFVIIPILGSAAVTRYNGFWQMTWFSMWVFILERIHGAKIYVTGDEILNEASLIVTNHPSEADWLFWPAIAIRHSLLYRMRFATKDMLRKIPGPGWAIESFQWLFLSRDWVVDKKQTQWTLSRYVKEKYPISMIIFPEGTDFTPAKSAKCNKFSSENNLPIYKNVLTPRTKGLCVVLRILRPILTSVYDMTIAYPDNVKPTLWSALAGNFPKEVHIHMSRKPISQVPKEKDEITAYCYQSFKEKDDLLEYFKTHGHFPRKYAEQAKPLGELPSSALYWFLFWVTYVGTCFYVLLFSGYAGSFGVILIVGFALLVATTVSDKVRKFRGIVPPEDFLSYRKNLKNQ